MTQETTIGLFRLPKELRNRIYEEVLSGVVVCYPSRSRQRKKLVFDEEPGAGLLLASKQIFEETLPIYNATSTFRFDDICRLLDWALNVNANGTNKPSSVCLVMEVDITEESVRTYVRKKRQEDKEQEASESTAHETSEGADDDTNKRISEEDMKKARESINKTATKYLQDDINLAAEKVLRFKNALTGKLYTLKQKNEAPQLHAEVIAQSITTKNWARTDKGDARQEPVLVRWGPFDDPFLETTPIPEGLSERTKALAKQCGFVYHRTASDGERQKAGQCSEELESSPHCDSSADDPFVDTPPSKNVLGRLGADSAIEICEPKDKDRKTERAKITCDPSNPAELSPIQKIASKWKNAVVPKLQEPPIGRTWV
ncbi:hypothetical protein CLAFUW4_12078 [Fulvia fulva]|uniref:Uncharacterized protein n=1 Tax=Passalora fulva TaxID=5499 RepID=A0A9Q8UST4_PASFU|nr:uncharacterized protein CLAFUR5_11117 [Fulvia fulva]KAK4618008.1 hypothetical protein CLAFUR4_12083 [Fulvia fulva]KAK4619080.1 hypothetical protein CLAFUR0_12094 [Fulvia fulva]UJO21117.1 hypothetical protein CLAFUR5_11117 [Fulvia fulva]WPV17956.1 hypothetical protein CLAFUW4_12078 [Fulvia fulva]WPV32991.1 hypothetical protein CLAFUW7_12085 [Fulvia fulva]